MIIMSVALNPGLPRYIDPIKILADFRINKNRLIMKRILFLGLFSIIFITACDKNENARKSNAEIISFNPNLDKPKPNRLLN